MNSITTLQDLARLVIAFLLALLPLHQLLAQEKESEKTKTLHIKMIREVNGQVQVTDTVVQAAEHEELFGSIRGIKIDTALVRQLRSNLNGTFRFDTTLAASDIKTRIYTGKGVELDTAAFRRLHGGAIRVYKLDKNIQGLDQEALLKHIKTQDTTLFRRLQGDTKVFHIQVDSLEGKRVQRVEVISGADAVTFRSGNPAMIYKAEKGEGNVFLLNREAITLPPLDADEIEKMIVSHGNRVISLDSLQASSGKKTRLKVVRDKETGEAKVYKIDAQGREEEIKADYLKLDHADARIMIITKAKVEDITEADKEALKEAGAAVETKPRHELEVEEISFYPNPNNGRFNLSFTLDKEGATRISVMDSNGEEVFVDTVEGLSGEYSRQIDLTPFGPGLYYLQIAQGRKYHTKKILVN